MQQITDRNRMARSPDLIATNQYMYMHAVYTCTLRTAGNIHLATIEFSLLCDIGRIHVQIGRPESSVSQMHMQFSELIKHQNFAK